jgi:hypothetical protein
MFYLDTKYRFALPEGCSGIAGGIIAASAMPAPQLLRRDVRKYPNLQHRLFDPQLYLAGLDPNVARGPVTNLASFAWFGVEDVPGYDSGTHGTIAKWKAQNHEVLIRGWQGRAAAAPADIEAAARSAVEYQLNLGCEGIILAGPLTNIATQQYDAETQWIDAGLAACAELRVALPIYATVALSDTVVRGVDPTGHPLLHTITNQIASRPELAGAYILIEQTTEDGYVCTSRDTLMSLLLLIDDLVRGASRQVIVNYAGTFGAVAHAVGAAIWSSGYYRSQRRLKLADFDEQVALAKPRYFSFQSAGDIGLESDLLMLYNKGLGSRVLTQSTTGKILIEALKAGTFPASVPQWQYLTSNVDAAAAHYTEVLSSFGTILRSIPQEKKIDLVHRWLKNAAANAETLKQAGIAQKNSYTDVVHQRVWLEVFERWRESAGLGDRS